MNSMNRMAQRPDGKEFGIQGQNGVLKFVELVLNYCLQVLLKCNPELENSHYCEPTTFGETQKASFQGCRKRVSNTPFKKWRERTRKREKERIVQERDITYIYDI